MTDTPKAPDELLPTTDKKMPEKVYADKYVNASGKEVLLYFTNQEIGMTEYAISDTRAAPQAKPVDLEALKRHDGTTNGEDDYCEGWNACIDRLAQRGFFSHTPDLGKAIHYPECWDVAAYPTLEAALHEIHSWFKCSNEECDNLAKPAEESK